jgi:oligopeptide transport system substrate-binding protein
MDPGQQSGANEAIFGRNVFEPLLKPTPDLKGVVGAAATKYDVTSDGLTYTFHIRSNARWADGQQVRGQDFVFAWKRLLDPRLKASYESFFDSTVAGAQNYANIDAKDASAVSNYLNGLGLFAPDDQTFLVKLQKPAGYFKWVASLWVAAPLRKDIIEKYGESWATVPSQIVGNGPFKVSEMVAGDHYTMDPNTYYWGEKPKLSKIIAYFIPDPRQAFARYQAGDLDVLEVPLANATVVGNDPTLSHDLHRWPSLDANWLGMNVERAPFNNQQVRLAVSRAIDRDKLAQFFGHGQFTPSQTMIPEGMNGYRPDLGKPQSFDPVAARQALAASGVSQSVLNGVHYLTPKATEFMARARFIVDQIKTNLGLSWTIDAADGATVRQRRARGDFQINEFGWAADYPDDQDWMDPFVNGCPVMYIGCPKNANYDQIVSQADQMTRQADRQKLYDQAQAIIINDYWLVFLYFAQTWDLVKPYVRGYVPTAIDESGFPGDFFTNRIYITKH